MTPSPRYMADAAGKEEFNMKYQFLNCIGSGGQGGVFRFLNRLTNEVVVVKEYGILSCREWRMLRQLRHPHIVQLVDPLRYENRVVKVTKIVVEAMDTSLHAFMVRSERRPLLDPEKDRLDPNLACKVFYPIALALDYLHHKLAVHLDIKPDNVLLKLDDQGRIASERDGRLIVKLVDFGLATYLGGDGDGPCKFSASGTSRYIAPEVESGTRYGVKADVWSLGVVLHVMLTCRFPTTALNQPAIIDESIQGEELRDLLQSMLHGNPYQRPYMHEVLSHPWVQPVRVPNDVLLGELREAEASEKVLLLQINRPSGRPLDVNICYMDLGDQLNDPKAAVVVSACRQVASHVKNKSPSTVAAIMTREGLDPSTEFQDAFIAVPPSCEALTRVERRSGQPMPYLRSLWLALVDDQKTISKTSIWGVYEGMRKCAAAIAAEQDTNLYICMAGCDKLVEGFKDTHSQRQFITQEIISLAQYLADTIPADKLETITLYTWQQDSLDVLMEFVKSFRQEFKGVMNARLDDEEYQRCVSVLRASVEKSSTLRGDCQLASLVDRMTNLDTYPGVVYATHAIASHIHTGYLTQALSDGPVLEAVNSALEVVWYNKEKADYEESMTRLHGRATFIPLVGYFDAFRSLTALLTLIRLF